MITHSVMVGSRAMFIYERDRTWYCARVSAASFHWYERSGKDDGEFHFQHTELVPSDVRLVARLELA